MSDSTKQQREEVERRLLARVTSLPFSGYQVLAAELLRLLGYSSVWFAGRHAKRGRKQNGGLDLIACVDTDVSSSRVLVQLKQYRIQRRFVDELRSAMPRHRGSEGLIVSTLPAGKTARDIAASPCGRPVRIIDGPELAALLIQHRLGVRVVGDPNVADTVFEVDEDFFAPFLGMRKAASKPHSSSKQQQKAYPPRSLREVIRAVLADQDRLMIRLVVEPIIAAALVGCVVVLVAFLLKHVFHLPTN